MTTWNEEPLSRGPVGTKLIAGLTIMAAGILMTADNLGVLDAEPWFRFWPIALIGIGLLKLASRDARLLGGILTVVGVWILTYNLGIFPFTIFDLWPLVLIGIGAALIARAALGDRADGATAPDSGSAFAILATRKIAPSGPYAGGKIAAIMSTFEIDLSGAEIGNEPAVIEAFSFWSGIEITVPSHWEVVGEVVPIMGGFEMKSERGPAVERRPRLVIRGLALMAGIEVKTAGRNAS
ncbi:MAG TPA: DUF5668 domain-containing protein [Thermoanaerobaculia bacterium]|nr:DUF5668 domain-containing protein [Thermoanaerobaculia bacterium]